jgi:hypothetical protein
MCKDCELKFIEMVLNPLDLKTIKEKTQLPASFKELEKNDFYPDLLDRAYAHLVWINRRGDDREISNAKAFISAIGKGFLNPFDRKRFEPKKGDNFFELKTKALNAISELSLEFGNRVSSVMWDALAHLATREEPETKKSILKEADKLPHHYGIVDTMLHAKGKVYSFSLHVQSVFFKHTGRVLIHNCDCDCSLLNLLEIDGEIRFVLSENGKFEATQSLFTHMCAESHLILDEKLPFEYTITKEAQELLGVQIS